MSKKNKKHTELIKQMEILYGYYQEWLLEDYLQSRIYVPWTFLHFLMFNLNYPYEETYPIYRQYVRWSKKHLA